MQGDRPLEPPLANKTPVGFGCWPLCIVSSLKSKMMLDKKEKLLFISPVINLGL